MLEQQVATEKRKIRVRTIYDQFEPDKNVLINMNISKLFIFINVGCHWYKTNNRKAIW